MWVLIFRFFFPSIPKILMYKLYHLIFHDRPISNMCDGILIYTAHHLPSVIGSVVVDTFGVVVVGTSGINLRKNPDRFEMGNWFLEAQL